VFVVVCLGSLETVTSCFTYREFMAVMLHCKVGCTPHSVSTVGKSSTLFLTQPEVTFLNDKMLCNTCSEVFAFDQTDSILHLKERATAQAITQNFDNSKVKILQKEHDRYQLARKLSDSTQG
jgi:hypothetical protein